MKNPIEVKYFKECIPIKGVWYSLHGDIFISYLEKYHRYYSKESNFEILYKTVSKIIQTEISTYRGLRTKKEFKYDHAEIHLKERYKTIAKFKRTGNKIEIIPKEKLPF